jgi:elongation factor Tu
MLTKLHMNLATLGHVDHGKTTLTAAITAYAAKLGRANAETYDKIDAAPKEKTQGLITNTAHVAYETENIVYSQIDCPSHDDYVKNLICGSVRLDAAVLVVSAPDGPMPQTRAQILLASQVGIPSIIVYLNKCDQMDDEEQLMLVEEEVRELLNKYGFPGYTTPLIRGSAVQALNREASEYGVKSIQKLLEALDSNVVPDPHGDEDSPFLMPIEEVFAITGRGTLVTGKIDTGKVKVGDEVEIVGLKAARKAIVIGTEMWAPRKITNSQKSYGYKKAAQEAAGRNKAIPIPI